MGERRLKEFKGLSWDYTYSKLWILHSIPAFMIPKPGHPIVMLSYFPLNELIPLFASSPPIWSSRPADGVVHHQVAWSFRKLRSRLDWKCELWIYEVRFSFSTTGAVKKEEWGPEVMRKADKHAIITWTKGKGTMVSSHFISTLSLEESIHNVPSEEWSRGPPVPW